VVVLVLAQAQEQAPALVGVVVEAAVVGVVVEVVVWGPVQPLEEQWAVVVEELVPESEASC